jgi:hypothetical protein
MARAKAIRSDEPTCAFCGLKPRKSTREHIVSRWLLDLTETRQKKFEFQPTDGKPFSLDFSRLTLKACLECNNKFSILEENAKRVVKAILARDKINYGDVDVLLDWFDKVRIGLWLIELKRGGNPLQIDPKFHINTRISRKDRMVKISRFKHPRPALTFIGTNTLAFNFSPSAFGIAINDVIFQSVSFDFLTSKYLGYPFPVKIEAERQDEPRLSANLGLGTEAPSEPPLAISLSVRGNLWSSIDFAPTDCRIGNNGCRQLDR